MLNVLLLVIFTLAFLGLVGLILRKLPILKVIDVEQVEDVKQQEVKNSLVEARLIRQLVEVSKRIKHIGAPIKKYWHKLLAWQQNKLENWEKTVEQKIADRTAPARVMADALAKAEELFNKGELKKAEVVYLQFISQHPRQLEAYQCLAELYLEMRDYEQAREVYEYLANQGQDLESSLGLARVASGQGLLDEAKTQYLNSLARINSAQPHFELAKIYNQLGNIKDALEHLNEARLLEPNNPRVLDFYIELSIVNGQLTDAQSALDVLKEVNPENQKIAALARNIDVAAQKLRPHKARYGNRVTSFGLTIKGKK
ncbi:MAG: tetratricopeptide repeat protein [Patescibacteria group bacterium]